ncbi:16435_t:CDS:2, partial [Funneliformis geosporum]
MSKQKLSYRLNAYPLCLIYLQYSQFYNNSCSCKLTIIYWSRSLEKSKIFCTKSLTFEEAKKRNVKLDSELVAWFWANISPDLEISLSQSVVNICKKCLNKYDYLKTNNIVTKKLEEELMIFDLTKKIVPTSIPKEKNL